MCIFAKDCDVKNSNFVKAIRRSDDILSVDYKGDGVNLILLSINVNAYKCICNWPLPIGAFQDQSKQIVINKHNLVKNPNWREADQLAIYKRRREVELGATENNIS